MHESKVKWGNSRAYLSKIEKDGVELKLNQSDAPEHRAHHFHFKGRFYLVFQALQILQIYYRQEILKFL